MLMLDDEEWVVPMRIYSIVNHPLHELNPMRRE